MRKLILIIFYLVSAGLGLTQQRPHEPYIAHHDESYEFAAADIVVRWSQLAEDNALAVDPRPPIHSPTRADGP